MLSKLCAICVSSCLLFGGSLFADSANSEIAAWGTKKQQEQNYNGNGSCKPSCNKCCTMEKPCQKRDCCRKTKSCTEKMPCKKKMCCKKTCCSKPAPCKPMPCSQENPCPKKDCCRKMKCCTDKMPCKKPVCCRVPKPCCPCPEQCKDVTPSARGCYCKDHFIVFADFLYWNADEEQCINYAFENVNPNFLNNGSVINVDTDSDPGFRFGIGWNLPYDGWDLTGAWTYYHNSSKSSVTSPTNADQLGLQTLLLFTNQSNVSYASATWKMNFNAMNIDLGRAFYVSNALALRPYFGSETTWINRWLAVNYGPTDPAVALPNTPGKYRGRANWWGTGPKVGMNSKWYLACTNFHMMSNFGLSLLYGKGNTTAMTNQADSGVLNAQGVDLKETCWTVVPHMQLLVGLGWESCFCCDRYFFSISAGWELNEFWHLRSFMFPAGGATAAFSWGESVFMQGLTVRTQFEF